MLSRKKTLLSSCVLLWGRYNPEPLFKLLLFSHLWVFRLFFCLVTIHKHWFQQEKIAVICLFFFSPLQVLPLLYVDNSNCILRILEWTGRWRRDLAWRATWHQDCWVLYPVLTWDSTLCSCVQTFFRGKKSQSSAIAMLSVHWKSTMQLQKAVAFV